ncbi:unnamed protein product [Oppiella nova]|uniref:Carboxylesterase type B domain-containing protein n=1 Tax=Oppiella nova TaxID=334625 RepID=A0A7R9MCW9_9ACAR|nr:unnamed protein product [Oppiella nova]CAG2174660.1 unnamed protein product [Oppiella nova]
MNSGAYLYAFNEDRAEDHAKKWLKGAKLIGCEEKGAKFTEKVMQCLRAAKPEKLVNILEAKELTVGSIKMWNLVVIDGHFLPKRPQEMISSGDFKRDLNLMVSTTEDEGSFLLAYYYDSEKFSAKTPRNLTFKEAFNELQEISSELSSRTPVDGQEVAKLYFAGLSERNSEDLLRQTIGKAVGDYYITCPTLEFAKQVFRRSEFKVKVYQYLFNSKFQDILICGHWMGVCHGNDLFPMFGIPLVFADKFNEREKEISRQMIEILTDFAKKGEPPKQKDSLWPQYYSINDAIIAPYYEFTNDLRKDTNFGNAFKSVECEYLWRKYFEI